jgi:tetratricopeptide (TPR) repeat protein
MRNDPCFTACGSSRFAASSGTWWPLAALLTLLLNVSTARPQQPEQQAQQQQPQQQLNPGQQDLDNATLAKLSARSAADLEAVSELCESALAKGLDESNQAYARDLLKSTLYEQAALLSRLIFDQQPVDPRWPRIRQVCLAKLQRALEVDADMGNGNLLIARLQSLPGGDREAAKLAIGKALANLAEDPEMLSVAYQTRAALTEDAEQALQDLNRAIELFPRNLAAWRARGVHHLAHGEYNKALDDLKELLTRDPDDSMAHQAIAQTLRQLKQFDEAKEHLDRALAADPNSSVAYQLKARIDEEQGNLAAAMENINEAIRVQPQDIGALLYRARLLTAQQQFDLAREDVQQVLRLRPGLPQAILLQSVIAAAQEHYGEAIGHLQELLEQQPDSAEIKLQMATIYEADRRPRKAIELYSDVVAADAENWMAFRRRGDAYLSTAQQPKAIADYEAAMALHPDDPGILNNLAWVLSTSPHDELRNGRRANEIAKKACELTQYKAAHILSTLAASYAEQGNFEEAIKWSTKAVELDGDEPQLAKELESYRAGKAWREEQLVEENPEPLQISAEDASADSEADDDKGSTEQDEQPADQPDGSEEGDEKKDQQKEKEEEKGRDGKDESQPVFGDVPDLDLEFEPVQPDN